MTSRPVPVGPQRARRASAAQASRGSVRRGRGAAGCRGRLYSRRRIAADCRAPNILRAVCPVDGRLSADGLKRALVQEPDTPVVTRVRHDQVLFDVRTLLRDTDLDLDVEAFLDGTVFAGASIVPVSSKTGEGLEELLTALDNAVCSCWSEHLEAAAGSGAAPRLPIDRCFSIRGIGTVVTGTLHDGPVSVGDELVALPSQTRCRVRGGRFTGIPSARFPASASP